MATRIAFLPFYPNLSAKKHNYEDSVNFSYFFSKLRYKPIFISLEKFDIDVDVIYTVHIPINICQKLFLEGF